MKGDGGGAYSKCFALDAEFKKREKRGSVLYLPGHQQAKCFCGSSTGRFRANGGSSGKSSCLATRGFA